MYKKKSRVKKTKQNMNNKKIEIKGERQDRVSRRGSRRHWLLHFPVVPSGNNGPEQRPSDTHLVDEQ
jgi:hypothetical protein